MEHETYTQPACDQTVDIISLDQGDIKFGKRKAHDDSPSSRKIQVCLASQDGSVAPLDSNKPYKDKLVLSQSSAFITLEQQCKFSHDLFTKLVVLKQVDRKFISCLAEEDGSKYLILIDQHAAHERVCLEKLVSIHADKDGNDELQIRSSAINPHLKLSLASEEIEKLRKWMEHCHRLGVSLVIENDVDVIITRVPTCFLERESSEVKRGRSSVYRQLTESLVSECIRDIEEKGRLDLQLLPLTVRNVLNSLACHGAVKFGDELSINQCVQLMRALGQCQTPFQCAHGRPVMTPLLHLADLEKLDEPKVTGRPHYERLKESECCTHTTPVVHSAVCAAPP